MFPFQLVGCVSSLEDNGWSNFFGISAACENWFGLLMTEPNNAQHGHLVLVFQKKTLIETSQKRGTLRLQTPNWTSILRCGVNLLPPGVSHPKNGEKHGRNQGISSSRICSARCGAWHGWHDMVFGHPTLWGSREKLGKDDIGYLQKTRKTHHGKSFCPLFSGVGITYNPHFWFNTDIFHGFRVRWYMPIIFWSK